MTSTKDMWMCFPKDSFKFRKQFGEIVGLRNPICVLVQCIWHTNVTCFWKVITRETDQKTLGHQLLLCVQWSLLTGTRLTERIIYSANKGYCMVTKDFQFYYGWPNCPGTIPNSYLVSTKPWSHKIFPFLFFFF